MTGESVKLFLESFEGKLDFRREFGDIEERREF